MMISNFYERKTTKFLVYMLVIGLAFTDLIPAYAGTDAENSSNEPEPKEQRSQQDLFPFKPGDGLYVSTLPDSSSFLNQVFQIDDSGFVEFPIVGRVAVNKMTEQELSTFIKNNFQQYMRFPNVFVKPMLRLSILGGVARPGLYYIDYSHSLWDAVRLAGGTLDEEGIKKMHWERSRDDVVGDLVPYFQNGVSLKKIGFRSGDQLWTPTPGKPGFMDKLTGNILPIVSLGTTIMFLYLTYQRDTITSR
ncbi:MAG: polysaccharide biosynthesis/export family protein [Calditrichaceae bacterium]